MDINRLGKMPTLEDTIKMKDWKKDILTIPNILSLLRLIMIPIYLTIYLRADTPADYALSAAILAISCITDLLDGYIARRFHMISTVGKFLDPIADKVTQFSLLLCFVSEYPVLWSLTVLFVIKEGVQLVAMMLAYSKGKVLKGALLSGKICTTVLFLSMIGMVLFHDRISQGFVTIITYIDGTFMLIAFLQYIFTYWKQTPMIQDFSQE